MALIASLEAQAVSKVHGSFTQATDSIILEKQFQRARINLAEGHPKIKQRHWCTHTCNTPSITYACLCSISFDARQMNRPIHSFDYVEKNNDILV